MKVRYTATALRELSEIVSYIANENAKSAADLLGDIEHSIAMVADNPEIAPIVFKGEVRAKLIGRHQYRIFYAVSGDVLIIRNIRSTRQLRPWERT